MDYIELLTLLNTIAKAVFTLGDAFARLLQLAISFFGLALPLNMFRIVAIIVSLLLIWVLWEHMAKWLLVILAFVALSSVIGIFGGTLFG